MVDLDMHIGKFRIYKLYHPCAQQINRKKKAIFLQFPKDPILGEAKICVAKWMWFGPQMMTKKESLAIPYHI